MGKSLSFEKIKNYINSKNCLLITNENEFYLMEGLNSTKRLTIKCGICHELFERNYTYMKYTKHMCENCARKELNSGFKNSIETINKYLLDNNISTKLLSTNYKNNREKLLWKCECGEEFFRDLSNFKSKKNKSCNKCSYKPKSNKKRWTENALKEHIESMGLIFVSCGNGGGYDSKITIQCECGDNYTVRFHNFINSNQIKCQKCLRDIGREGMSYSIEHIDEYILKNNINVRLISKEYIDCKNNIQFMCECGDVFETNLDCFMHSNKTKCNKCSMEELSRAQRLTQDEVLSEIKVLNENIKVLSEYVNSQYPLTMECEYGHIFTKSYSNFKKFPTCVICNESKSEYDIRMLLSNKNINFEKEYEFEDLIGDFDNLRFDFAILNNNEELLFLIESDGRQHFEPVDYFGGEEEFIKRKRYDALKNEYCKNNNIRLFRIPYFQFDKIELMVNNIISRFDFN